MAQRKLTGIDDNVTKQYKEKLKRFEGKDVTPSKKDKKIKEKQDEDQPDWMPKLRKVARPAREVSKKPSPSQRTFQEKMKIFETGGRGVHKVRRSESTKKRPSSARKSEVKQPRVPLEKSVSRELLPLAKKSSSRHLSKSPRAVSGRLESKSPGVTWAPTGPSSPRRTPEVSKKRTLTPYPSPKEKSRSLSRREEDGKSASRAISKTKEASAPEERRSKSATPKSPSRGVKSPGARATSKSRERSASRGRSQSRGVSLRKESSSRGESRGPSIAQSPRATRFPSRGVSSLRETPSRVSEVQQKRSKTKSPSAVRSASSQRDKSRATNPRSLRQPATPISESSISDESIRSRELSHTPDSDYRRKSSAPLPLMSEEYVFHEIVRKGHIAEASAFLRSSKFDVNARGHDGETALQIAVENEDEPMTAFLISQPNTEVDDILLHAVQAGNVPIVKLLCEHIGPPDEMQSYPSSFTFPPDMTPLQLAATLDSYEIIDYLINERHHELEDPHSPDCNCSECTEARKDPLQMATRKLRQHKAVSTPAYYIHITRDPIYHSFKLYKYLKKMGRLDIVVRPSYVEIANVVRKFPVDLIAECRTSREVKSVLSQFGGSSKFWGKLTRSEWPRLIMAMDYKQKEFVAHSNIQVLLEDKWSGNFYAWRKAGKIRKTFSPVIRIFVLPYIYFLLLLKPESKEARHYALPVNKMISFLATYILFLVFVFFQANETRKPRRDRMYFFSEENSVYIFVFTYTISIARQIFVTHPKRFFSQGWNVYDVTMISLYWLTLAFWMSAFTHYLMLPTQHMKNLERKYWNAFDPMLVADGFFVVASIMAFLKLLFYFQLNFSVGPMQVALNVMIKDCAKYSLFITLIIFAFTAALGKFYSYYDGMKYIDPDSGEELEQESDSFVSLRAAFKCLFWGMFGMSDFSSADVIVENVQNPANETGSFLVEHDFTEFVGYFSFGAYTILMTIVVINMLIATMSDTFAKVLGDLDTEWMVGRTEVYLYFVYQTILPPPLNILPHRYPPKHLTRADDEEKLLKGAEEAEENYDEVAKRLVARYFAKLGKT